MNLLALDMAESCGWARRIDGVVESGVEVLALSSDQGRPLCFRQGLRLSRFQRWLHVLLEGVHFVAYEAPILYRPTSARSSCQYEGVLLATLAARSIAHRSVEPKVLKKYATGDGAADKAAMIATARERWKVREDIGDDQADALWVLAWSIDTLGGA